MKKIELLFYKIDIFLQKTTTCITFHAKHIFSGSIYFFSFGRDFCGLFSMLFPKVRASSGKKIINFCSLLYCTSTCMSSKTVPQIFKVFFQTGDFNIFVLFGVFFSIYVQLKSSFSDVKNISGKV